MLVVNKLCGRPPQYAPPRGSDDSGRRHINCWRRDKLYGNLNSQPKPPGDLDLLTLKVVSQSRVTWATSVPILFFLGLSLLDLGPMYATDIRRRQTSDAHHHLMPPPRGQGHNKLSIGK